MGTGWVAGIEIGGTKLQLGIGQGHGDLAAFERVRVEPSQGARGILNQIEKMFPALLRKLGLSSKQIDAVGVGFGGPVDASEGRTRRSYQITGWDGLPLAPWLRTHLGVPLAVLENDADAAGIAESRFGAGIGHSPLLYVTVGSGIGGALIINDRIYRGSGLGAAEIGHLRVPDTTPSGMRLLELEQVASGWAIASAAQEAAQRMIQAGSEDWVVLTKASGQAEGITAAAVAEAAAEGDSDSESILDRARRAVAFALTQAIALVAPRRIVIGGGVSLIGERHWFDPVRRIVDADVFEPFRGGFDIVAAALGETVVVHGALALARDGALNSEKAGC